MRVLATFVLTLELTYKNVSGSHAPSKVARASMHLARRDRSERARWFAKPRAREDRQSNARKRPTRVWPQPWNKQRRQGDAGNVKFAGTGGDRAIPDAGTRDTRKTRFHYSACGCRVDADAYLRPVEAVRRRSGMARVDDSASIGAWSFPTAVGQSSSPVTRSSSVSATAMHPTNSRRWSATTSEAATWWRAEGSRLANSRGMTE